MNTSRLTTFERERLARAIRGDIPRFDVSANELRRRLRELSPSVRELLVEAFARREHPQLRLF
jgi:hypothetical protein